MPVLTGGGNKRHTSQSRGDAGDPGVGALLRLKNKVQKNPRNFLLVSIGARPRPLLVPLKQGRLLNQRNADRELYGTIQRDDALVAAEQTSPAAPAEYNLCPIDNEMMCA
jgi:hypothetical protein